MHVYPWTVSKIVKNNKFTLSVEIYVSKDR